MVYVLSKNGQPLMPTERHGKVKHLLQSGLAKVVKREPFTIQLCYEGTNYVQPITLGVDAGSKVVGLSATTEKKEVYASETTLRSDIVDLLSTRRQHRRGRRSRLRYRAPRWQNRKKTKQEGWLAPSVQHKIESHLKLVAKVHTLLPVQSIAIEVAAFDIQKIKNPGISGVDYQEGDQLGFWNVREYVLFRDNHTCQHCKGKSKDKILNVHHIESRKTGGDSPSNLITLCETCHELHHKGKITLKAKRGASFRDAAFMGIMRWAFYNQAKELYPNVRLTYGYITKNDRISHSIEKTHATDAYCISGNLKAKRISEIYIQKFVRHSNRSLHKANLLKGGRRKSNKAPALVHGYRLFDKVLYDDRECFIFGRRSTGYFDLRLLDGTTIHKSANCKKLKLINPAQTILTERSARVG